MKNFLLYPVIIGILLPFHSTPAHSNKYRILHSYGKVTMGVMTHMFFCLMHQAMLLYILHFGGGSGSDEVSVTHLMTGT